MTPDATFGRIVSVGDQDEIHRTSFIYETDMNYCIVCPNMSVSGMGPSRRHTISWLQNLNQRIDFNWCAQIIAFILPHIYETRSASFVGERYMDNHSPVSNQYNDVIMSAMASQMTSLTIVYSTFNSGADQRKHQSSASLAFVREIHRKPVNSPHKKSVTRKMFPFDDVIIFTLATMNFVYPMGVVVVSLFPNNVQSQITKYNFT